VTFGEVPLHRQLVIGGLPRNFPL